LWYAIFINTWGLAKGLSVAISLDKRRAWTSDKL
jgi:hypothetical protein